MRRFLVLIPILLLVGCMTYSPKFCPDTVITKIKQHAVTIAVYYVADSETSAKIMNDQTIGLVKIPVMAGQYQQAIAIIGSGTIIKGNRVLSVRHMFDDHYGISPSMIYVFVEGLDHAVEADLVCKSQKGNFRDDYAVVQLRENLGLPGLRIATQQPTMGEKVIYSGSVGGFAFFTRFGHVTKIRWYLHRGTDGVLHLTPWEEFAFQTVYPGGPGDSGGSICNTRGELVGIMYCGLTNYSEEYIFSNPIELLIAFLKDNGIDT